MNKDYFKKVLESNPFDIFLRLLETDSGKIAAKRTSHVLKITLLIYIPLLIITFILFVKFNAYALLFLLLVFLSVFPYCKYVLIPLSEKKRAEIEKSVRG